MAGWWWGGFTYIYNEFNKTSLTAGAESRVLRLCVITHPSPRDGDATLQPTWNNRAGEFPPLLSKAEPSQSVNTLLPENCPPDHFGKQKRRREGSGSGRSRSRRTCFLLELTLTGASSHFLQADTPSHPPPFPPSGLVLHRKTHAMAPVLWLC